MLRVAVLDDYQGKASTLADWASLGADVRFFNEPLRGDALLEAIEDVEALVLMRERTAFSRAVLERLTRLRVVVTTGMGNASLDVSYLHEREVVVCGTTMAGGPSDGVPSTAEIAWALIFAVTKRVVIEDRAIRDGRWQLGFPTLLGGKTLSLAGLGRLGAAMVAPARAFGMEVLAWSEHLTEARAAEHGVSLVSKEELLGRADVLSIHLVLSERTRGLFGARELARLAPGAILINTSRGPIVDEEALVAALSSGALAGAGLDVYDAEPLPFGHPLTALQNVVLLPHLGYVSEAGLASMYAQVVEDLAAFVSGSPIRTI